MLPHSTLEGQKKASKFGEKGAAASMQHVAPFDAMVLHTDSTIEARPPSREEIGPMLERAAAEIGAPLASASVVRAILAHDPESVWLFLRSGRPIGTFALLYLTREGVAALCAGELDLRSPPLRFLAAPGERPAGIYFWAMLARGRAASGVAHVFRLLRTGRRYAGVDLWALPYTADGRRFADRLGFAPAGATLSGLMRCVRGYLSRETAA